MTGITLTVGAQQSVNIALKVGETSQQVELPAPRVAIELACVDHQPGGDWARRFESLPLNGRSWTDLAQLQPALTLCIRSRPPTRATERRAVGHGVDDLWSAPHIQYYRLNGVSLNDNMNTAPGSFLAGNLGVDSIGEFSVLTGNFSAEYGKSAGG